MLLLLFACTVAPPSLMTVDPTSGPAGTAVTIQGLNFVEGMTVKLGGKALDDLVVTPPDTITGTVPEGVNAGPVSLALSTPAGQRIARDKAFEVVKPVAADPCGSKERRLTHIPSTAEVVKIDLYGDDDDVTRTEISTRDIQAVEYERRVRKTGGTCAAIYLATGANRVLFDAQADVDLSEQAQKIAVGLGKKLTVVADEKPPAAQ